MSSRSPVSTVAFFVVVPAARIASASSSSSMSTFVRIGLHSAGIVHIPSALDSTEPSKWCQ
jgi:hypothetical protein